MTVVPVVRQATKAAPHFSMPGRPMTARGRIRIRARRSAPLLAHPGVDRKVSMPSEEAHPLRTRSPAVQTARHPSPLPLSDRDASGPPLISPVPPGSTHPTPPSYTAGENPQSYSGELGPRQ
jgi:hypothetical protein